MSLTRMRRSKTWRMIAFTSWSTAASSARTCQARAALVFGESPLVLDSRWMCELGRLSTWLLFTDASAERAGAMLSGVMSRCTAM